MVTVVSAREAAANPALDGTRNLSLAGISRGSSVGANAALANPSMMPFAPVFTVEALYQLNIQSRTNGLGFVVMDSLNNPRISVALGYSFMRGSPEIRYATTDTGSMDGRVGDGRGVAKLSLSRFGHEAFAALALVVLPKWVTVGVKPKYQYVSLRYRDREGLARNAHERLNAFGLDTSATLNFASFATLCVLGLNVTGNHTPYFTAERDVQLQGVSVEPGSIDHRYLSQVSDYPLMLAHALSVFPLRNMKLSINFDGTYDFSSFRHNAYTRLTYGGSVEFVAGAIPLRIGTVWDSRGRGGRDDRIFVAGGLAYAKSAKEGGMGVDLGFGFQQQVDGPLKETILGINLGLRLHPDL